MLYGCINRVHRHTKPASYMDNSRKARQQRAQRPGSNGFSFTGEFPEVHDSVPVEAAQPRRQYATASGDVGVYRAVGNSDASRMPRFSRHGVQLHTALLLLGAIFMMLACVYLFAWSGTTGVSKRISHHQQRIEELSVANAEAELQIAARANDVKIRQEAVRLGLISSAGVDVIYLNAPESATITPTSATQYAAADWQ